MGITSINGISITASAAATSSNVTTIDNSSGAGNYFPLFVVSSTTGIAQTPQFDTNYYYNPIANTLTVTNITSSGGLFGTASFSTVSSASRIGPISTNATHYIPFTPQFIGGGLGPVNFYQESQITYNPSTLEFRASLINNQAAGTKTSTADANLTIDASLTQSMTWIASFTATRSLIINNLTDGRNVIVYIRNTNATQRQIIFSGSASTTGHVLMNMSVGAGVASATTQNIAGTSGTMLVHAFNIKSNFVGGLS